MGNFGKCFALHSGGIEFGDVPRNVRREITSQVKLKFNIMKISEEINYNGKIKVVFDEHLPDDDKFVDGAFEFADELAIKYDLISVGSVSEIC